MDKLSSAVCPGVMPLSAAGDSITSMVIYPAKSTAAERPISKRVLPPGSKTKAAAS
jgi:hypothetical protein